MDTTPNILIVDDSAGMRLLVRREIEKISTVPSIAEAVTGREVLEAVELMEFDVIFLDINMPDMDGLSCLEALRGNGYLGPIIMCTANADMARIRDARDTGASAYIVKPVTARKIEEAIAPYVNLTGLTEDNSPEPDFRLTR